MIEGGGAGESVCVWWRRGSESAIIKAWSEIESKDATELALYQPKYLKGGSGSGSGRESEGGIESDSDSEGGAGERGSAREGQRGEKERRRRGGRRRLRGREGDRGEGGDGRRAGGRRCGHCEFCGGRPRLLLRAGRPRPDLLLLRLLCLQSAHDPGRRLALPGSGINPPFPQREGEREGGYARARKRK